MIFDLITGKTAFRQALNLAPKKVFNNEVEFGMILNKRLKGRGETAEKRSEDSWKEIRKRFIYRTNSIYIFIVFNLYINHFRFIYKSFSFNI